MKALELALDARVDVAAILAASQDKFGVRARRRYRRLLETAFADLQADPDRAGVRIAADAPPGFRLYALRHSRTHAPVEDRVGRPRHVIVFRLEPERIVIAHVLHEHMDLPRRLWGM